MFDAKQLHIILEHNILEHSINFGFSAKSNITVTSNQCKHATEQLV